MPASEEDAFVTEIRDRLIDLYVQQDKAKRAEDRVRARELQIEIEKSRARQEEIRQALRIA